MADSDQKFPAVRISAGDPRVEREAVGQIVQLINVLARDVSKIDNRLVRIEEKVGSHVTLRSDIEALRESSEVRTREIESAWIDRLMAVERAAEARVREIEKTQAAADKARDERLTTIRTQVGFAAVLIPLLITLIGKLVH